MKVLLIEPKRTKEEATTLGTHYSYPHLGLLSIAANLESNSNKVDYFNTNIYKYPVSVLRKKLKKRYDFIGISTTTATIDYSLKIAEVIKKNSLNTKVVFGGVHAWLHPKEILEDQNVDFVIRGLGEIPFLRLTENESLEKIPGLCYKKESRIIIKSPFIPKEEDFQKIKSILEYSKYDQVYKKTKTFRNTRHLFTSFGCPFNCNFCSVPKLYKRRMLFKDINLVLNEIKELSKKTNRIMFVDPDLNINRKHFISLFTSILNEKRKRNINKNTKFIIQARLDCFDDEMLKTAKKANVIALIGIESLSKEIRDIDLNKGGKLAKMTEKEIKEKIKKIKKYVKPYLYFILATPKTRLKDLVANLKYIRNLKKGWYEVNIHIIPFPETNYYEKYKNTKLIVQENLKINSRAKKIPIALKCEDKKVEVYIEKAYERAKGKYIKNRRLNFSNLFLKELIKETNL